MRIEINYSVLHSASQTVPRPPRQPAFM